MINIVRRPFLLALFSGFVSFIVSGTAMAQVSTERFLGEWEAEWRMAAHAPEMDIAENKTRYMSGRMDFSEGTVKIEAFGYPGCLFSSDTIKNELHWTISGGNIKLFDNNDQFSLEYAIQKVSGQVIELSLMDDISVILTR